MPRSTCDRRDQRLRALFQRASPHRPRLRQRRHGPSAVRCAGCSPACPNRWRRCRCTCCHRRARRTHRCDLRRSWSAGDCSKACWRLETAARANSATAPGRVTNDLAGPGASRAMRTTSSAVSARRMSASSCARDRAFAHQRRDRGTAASRPRSPAPPRSAENARSCRSAPAWRVRTPRPACRSRPASRRTRTSTSPASPCARRSARSR